MNDKKTDFDEIIQKMINDYNLTTEDLKTIIEFQATIDSGEYNPKINKKAFILFSKDKIRPFESQEMPESFICYTIIQIQQKTDGTIRLWCFIKICNKVCINCITCY